jgi:7-carboxy-7-deazaguanine synthase
MLRVEQHGCKNVTITGGEPFMQEEALVGLCVELMREGYNISVETNGSFNFPPLGGVDYVVDFKLPSSGEYMHMKVNTPWIHLRPNDWIKFVIKDNLDYEVARAAIASLKGKGCRAQFAMSPILTNVSSNNLLSWLKADCISNVVVSVQLHKLLKLYESQ